MSEASVRNVSGSLKKLRDAARKLFVSEGYHNTRPQDIAREAGVAHGTFYLHFPDKKAVFLDFAEQAQAELMSAYAKSAPTRLSGEERWQFIFGVLIDFGTQNPGVLQAAFLDPVFIAPNDEQAWQIYDRLGKFMSVVVGDAGNPESAAADYDQTLISHAICGALRQAMTYSYRKGIDREKMIKDLGLFIDRGLGVKR